MSIELSMKPSTEKAIFPPPAFFLFFSTTITKKEVSKIMVSEIIAKLLFLIIEPDLTGENTYPLTLNSKRLSLT